MLQSKFQLLLIACLASGSLFSQQAIPSGRIIYLHEESSEIQANSRNIIWSEQFDNGFDNGWSSLGNAAWEYRGPSTNPNSLSGTRGSCIYDGQEFGAPINSVTALNGFAIFDSNYWDDENGPCGSFGTGLIPGPHSASLTSPIIDLSLHQYIGLRFTQYARNLNASFKVQISHGGLAWTQIYSSNLMPNEETERDDLVEINISALASLQDDVQIRFIFDGSYYFWMIDDIEIYDLADFDLELKDPIYGDFNINDPDHTTGFEFMEYSIFPVNMLQQLKLAALAINKGSQNQTGVIMNAQVVKLSEPEVQVYAGASEPVPLNTGNFLTLRMGTYQTLAQIADYEIRYQLDGSALDEDTPDNNEGVRSFRIDEMSLARDHRSLQSIFFPNPAYENEIQEIGNVFLITTENMPLHSISAALFQGSELGSSLSARIYQFEIDSEPSAQLIAESQEVLITESMINGLGEEIMTAFPFESPINLSSGAYYASIVSPDGANQAYIGLSGPAYEFTSFVHYPESEEWFTIPTLPMIRMNFGEIVSTTEYSNTTTSLFPNPARDSFQIQIDNSTRVEFNDIFGRNLQKAMLLNPGLNEVNCSQFSSGIYVLKFHDLTDDTEYTLKVIIE